MIRIMDLWSTGFTVMKKFFGVTIILKLIGYTDEEIKNFDFDGRPLLDSSMTHRL